LKQFDEIRETKFWSTVSGCSGN